MELKRYFYITTHFYPVYTEDTFAHIHTNQYKNVLNGSLYRKRLLYDFGWGQEYGFELLPELSFIELIKLVEQPYPLPQRRIWHKYSKQQMEQADIWKNNLYGAISVIMQDHVEALIDYLAEQVKTSLFSDASIRENYKGFTFDSQAAKAEGRIPGGVLTSSYEEILNRYPKWREISPLVVKQIYH